MKRLILLVEGHGDGAAALILTKKLLNEQPEIWKHLFLDPNPFRIGGIASITGDARDAWPKKLKAACKKDNTHGILTILDGDSKSVENSPFCASNVARLLAERARKVGAGTSFSLAIVFARQEFESWLIAGVSSFAGKTFANNRTGIREGTIAPDGDLESSPRDAKGWLSSQMHGRAYKPAIDQRLFAESVEIQAIRQRKMRSFVRMEHAIAELTAAFTTGRHVLSPSIGGRQP